MTVKMCFIFDRNATIFRLFCFIPLFHGEWRVAQAWAKGKKMLTMKCCPCVYISLNQITLWLFWINEAPGAKR